MDARLHLHERNDEQCGNSVIYLGDGWHVDDGDGALLAPDDAAKGAVNKQSLRSFNLNSKPKPPIKTNTVPLHLWNTPSNKSVPI